MMPCLQGIHYRQNCRQQRRSLGRAEERGAMSPARRSMTIQDFKIPRKITSTSLIGMQRSASGAERSETANNKDLELWFADPSERIRASVIGFAVQANKWAIPIHLCAASGKRRRVQREQQMYRRPCKALSARAIRMGIRASDCRFHLSRICSRD